MPFFKFDETIAEVATEIIAAATEEFPSLTPANIACTWVIYDRNAPINTGGAIAVDSFWEYIPKGFSHRGDECIYPASVVKLFYLVAINEWLARGMTSPSAEISRAITDTVRDSSNDATSLLVDILSGTTSGPELPAAPFETWKQQRNIINRYYSSLGWPELQSINVNQKTWSEGPYGRERSFVGANGENRNKLTTDAIARILHAIVGGVAVNPEKSQEMLALLKRDLNLANVIPPPGEENQVNGFLGEGLPPNSNLYSKAGWMSRVRHDAAYIEIPDRPPYLLTIFTESPENATNRHILPWLSAKFAAAIGY
jgi:hypothetical protein